MKQQSKLSGARLVRAFKSALFPIGTNARIRIGHLKGFQYRISENSAWAPIVGGWEPGAHALFGQIVPREGTVYDIGANAGLHTMLLSKLVGKTGRVFAFEPLPSNVEEIYANIALNGLTNIEIVCKAVAKDSGHREFRLGSHDKQGSLNSSIQRGKSGLLVETISIDSFVDAHPPPCLMKIDIEGAEGEALIGAERTLRLYAPILSVELHSPEQDVIVGTFLSDLGYGLFRFDPNMRSMPTLERVRDPVLGWPHPEGTWGTILAFPAEKLKLATLIQQRGRT